MCELRSAPQVWYRAKRLLISRARPTLSYPSFLHKTQSRAIGNTADPS